ncbi:MAG: hypothetical protein AAGA48_00350 [Myxococcota bacterium]
MRTFVLAATVALAGCYDFVGERGKVGFGTDLYVPGGMTWTPRTPIASGSVVGVVALCAVDSATGDCEGEQDMTGELMARGIDVGRKRLPEWQESVFAIRGQDGDRGVVRYEDEDRHDRFRVQFSEPVAASVVPEHSEQDPAQAWAVLSERATQFEVWLTNSKGEGLAFPVDQLWVDTDTDWTVEWEEGRLSVVPNGEDGEVGIVRIGFDDRMLGELELRVTDREAIDGWEAVVSEDADGQPYVERVWWADGWPVATFIEGSMSLL